MVLLEGTTVTKVPKNTRGKENCLCIQCSERIFYAYADSSAEADSWVEAIRQLFAYSVIYLIKLIFMTFVII